MATVRMMMMMMEAVRVEESIQNVNKRNKVEPGWRQGADGSGTRVEMGVETGD